jgi:hypothetical protein
MFGAEWGYGEGLARRVDVVNLSNGRNFRGLAHTDEIHRSLKGRL